MHIGLTSNRLIRVRYYTNIAPTARFSRRLLPARRLCDANLFHCTLQLLTTLQLDPVDVGGHLLCSWYVKHRKRMLLNVRICVVHTVYFGGGRVDHKQKDAFKPIQRHKMLTSLKLDIASSSSGYCIFLAKAISLRCNHNERLLHIWQKPYELLAGALCNGVVHT